MFETFEFHVSQVDGLARRGELRTAHGVVNTPAFMPVGTGGAVKAITHRDLMGAGGEILLANTYHLFLRPGDQLIARAGGLHRFIGWSGPILTDSGGYQVFSLGERRVIDETGVRFRSHLDGTEFLLTPERASEIQARLGADIAMAFDECTPFPVSVDQARRSTQLTLRWARRSRSRFLELRDAADGGLMTNPGQVQFGIVQGGVFPELREQSVHETVAMGFEAYAIGGLSVGEPTDMAKEVAGQTASLLPSDRLRYLMGVGTPATWWRWWLEESICSTACFLLGTREMGSCSRGRGGSTSKGPDTPRIMSRPIPSAYATRAATSPGHTCAICPWRTRLTPLPLTRCTIYTFTLTP